MLEHNDIVVRPSCSHCYAFFLFMQLVIECNMISSQYLVGNMVGKVGNKHCIKGSVPTSPIILLFCNGSLPLL